MTKKEFAKINKELTELKKLLKIHTKPQANDTPADGRWVSDNEYWNRYYYWQDFNAPNFYLPKCCQKCPNNPINNPFANGVCCCSLPSQETIRW